MQIFTSIHLLNLDNNSIKILKNIVAVNKDSVSFIQYTVSYTVYLNKN